MVSAGAFEFILSFAFLPLLTNRIGRLFTFYNLAATVAYHVAHPLVVEKVIDWNLGLTPRHY